MNVSHCVYVRSTSPTVILVAVSMDVMCGEKLRGIISHQSGLSPGFLYCCCEYGCNVLWKSSKGWSLIRVVFHQGFYCIMVLICDIGVPLQIEVWILYVHQIPDPQRPELTIQSSWQQYYEAGIVSDTTVVPLTSYHSDRSATPFLHVLGVSTVSLQYQDSKNTVSGEFICICLPFRVRVDR